MEMLVTGGSGALGRRIAAGAAKAGIDVGVMSRGDPRFATVWPSVQADLASGRGLDAAVTGADVVIHAASDPRHPEIVDVGGTARLLDAARRARVRHLIYVSIVGVDEIPYSYYRRKFEAEGLVKSSGVPFTIIRATQFHSFVDAILGALAGVPLILPVPRGFKVQSVDIDEVAARILRAAATGPLHDTVNFAGPEVLPLSRVADRWLEARALHKRPLTIPLPGAIARAFRAGKNTATGAERGVVSWETWLNQAHAPEYELSTRRALP